MVRDSILGKMEEFIKVIINLIKNMALEYIFGLMEEVIITSLIYKLRI
jgi:hypothetical protein